MRSEPLARPAAAAAAPARPAGLQRGEGRGRRTLCIRRRCRCRSTPQTLAACGRCSTLGARAGAGRGPGGGGPQRAASRMAPTKAAGPGSDQQGGSGNILDWSARMRTCADRSSMLHFPLGACLRGRPLVRIAHGHVGATRDQILPPLQRRPQASALWAGHPERHAVPLALRQRSCLRVQAGPSTGI